MMLRDEKHEQLLKTVNVSKRKSQEKMVLQKHIPVLVSKEIGLTDQIFRFFNLHLSWSCIQILMDISLGIPTPISKLSV